MMETLMVDRFKMMDMIKNWDLLPEKMQKAFAQISTLVEVQDETDDNTPYCTARNIGFQLSECEVDDTEYHEVQLIMSKTIDNQSCPSKESIDA
ncbi:hypothetical protein Hamer_G007627 [Homarus americanus]|uniref:Uncharacterized protein n=1 Tax=Homarus americanus TaxID=6706 RepID=A0A8J5MRG1_HOMAM|nr:hypothetical protein Hamer_G007627 [Homarus americanus]